MIDRRIAAIGLGFTAFMLMLALWRVSLLPDWSVLPRFSADGRAIEPDKWYRLFVAPFAMLVTLAVFFLNDRLTKTTGQRRKPWLERNVFVVAAVGCLFLAAQAVTLAKSFAASAAFSGADALRVIIIMQGLLMITLSNRAPKLPWLASHIKFVDLNDANGAKLLRLTGIMGIAAGLAIIATALTVPMDAVRPLLIAVSLTMVGGLWIFRLALKNRQAG